jgi:D-lactate dehydrogenase (cytochrome)
MQAHKVKMGTLSPKSSAGYNLLNLFVGSEGTLGVINQITLKIRKNFSYYNTICCQFEEIKQAVNFVIALKGIIQFRRMCSIIKT